MRFRAAADRIIRAAPACALISFGLGGCRQIVGVEDREPPGSCGALAEASQACAECTERACCAEAEACSGSASCAAAAACLAACGAADDACKSGCDATASFGEARAALVTCQSSRCAGECGLSCGAPGTLDIGCDPCAAACCAEAAACSASAECNRVRVCQDACSKADPTCRERCKNVHPEGASLQSAVDECVARSCDIDADWSCLGSIEWPGLQGPPSQLTYSLHVSGGSGNPFPGLSVTACHGLDQGCDPVMGSGVTNAQGDVSLKVASPFDGYVHVVGEPVYPFLLYRFPPAAEDAYDGAGVPTFAEATSGLGLDRLPGLGHISMNVLDCNGAFAPGVSVSVSPANEDTQTLYAGDDGTLASGSETGSLAQVSFLGVPPGIVQVTATVGRLCRRSSRVNVVVLPDTFTYSPLPPSP